MKNTGSVKSETWNSSGNTELRIYYYQTPELIDNICVIVKPLEPEMNILI